MLLTAQADDFRCLWKAVSDPLDLESEEMIESYLTWMWGNELKSYEEQYELVIAERATSLAHENTST